MMDLAAALSPATPSQLSRSVSATGGCESFSLPLLRWAMVPLSETLRLDNKEGLEEAAGAKFISIFKAYRWWQRPACAKGLQSHHLKTKHRASMNSFLILMPWTKSIQSEKLFPAFVLKPWHDITSITEVQTRTRQQPALHPAAQHASRYPADI